MVRDCVLDRAETIKKRCLILRSERVYYAPDNPPPIAQPAKRPTMSNSNKKDPSEDSEPNHKRIVSGSGETILPENSPSEQETHGADDTEWGSGFRLPDEFTLIRRLGRGGMGEVYLVERDSGFSREQLALKTILPEHLGNQGAIELFFDGVHRRSHVARVGGQARCFLTG